MSAPLRRIRLGAAVAVAAVASVSMAPPAQAAAQVPDPLVQDVVGAEPVAPGDVFTYQPIVHNGTGTTIPVIQLELFDDDYAHHTQRFSNCRYTDDSRNASCVFEIDLAPGETAQVPAESAVELRVLPNAPDGWRINAFYWVFGFDSIPVDPDGEFGDGPELQLVKLPDGPFEGGQEGSANVLFDVGENSADLAAHGAQISGEVGDVVVLEVGASNAGPADIGPLALGVGFDPTNGAALTVNLPAGVSVVEVLGLTDALGPPGNCVPIVDGEPDLAQKGAPGATSYLCNMGDLALAAGDTWRFQFRVEITGSEDATGQVQVAEGPNDPDLANNTAEVVLAVAGGGSGGGLPATGARTGLLAGAGALAVLLGLGLYLLARRRKHVVEEA